MSMVVNLYLTDELAMRLIRTADKEKKKCSQIVKVALVQYLRDKK